MNPVNFSYGSTANLENVAASAIIVTGMGNRDAEAFQQARARGAEVFEYWRPISRLDSFNDSVNREFYMDGGAVPLWGNDRRNNDYSHLIDLRVGSVWANWLVDEYLPRRMAAGTTDGVFLDVLGARPWGKQAQWDTWSAAERYEWTAGAVDLMRRLHERRMQVNENFKLVCNNVWFLPPKDPSAALAKEGNKYCNGVCIEHHPAVVNGAPSWHANHVGQAFVEPRRVLVIAISPDDAQAWTQVHGVSHICAQWQYSQAEAPLVPYEDMRLDEANAYAARLKERLAAEQERLTAERVAVDARVTELDAKNQILTGKLANILEMARV